jgi:dolichol-phosphate mannosyltransferase
MNLDYNGQRALAVIPVYDEYGKIGTVISRFANATVEEICAVVDRPSKAILSEIEEASEKICVPVKVIENPRRNGVGYAIREGIDYALRQNYDIVVVLAGNSKDDPREIPRFLKILSTDLSDYVQGSRFLAGAKREKTPVLRSIFIRLYPFIWTLCTGVRCTDVTNGFRAYKTRILKDRRINLWQDWLDGYALEYYLHYKVLRLGYRTREVPVSKIYPHMHKGGYSKISPFRDFWSIIGPLFYLVTGVKK